MMRRIPGAGLCAVFLTALSFLTGCSSGAQQYSFRGTADSSGNIYAVGVSSLTGVQNSMLWKLGPTGDILSGFPKEVDLGGADRLNGIDLDSGRGLLWGVGEGNAAAVVAISDTQGVFLTSAALAAANSEAYGVIVDSNSYAWIVGFVTNSDQDFAVWKCSYPSLSVLPGFPVTWDSGGGDDAGVSLAIAPSGDLWLTGMAKPGGVMSLALWKMDQSGNLLGAPVTLPGGAGGDVVATEDAVWVVGGGAGGDIEMALAKFDLSGSLAPGFPKISGLPGDDYGVGLVVDESAGEVWVSGKAKPGDTEDTVISKFDLSGNLAADYPRSFDSGQNDMGMGLVLSPTGDIWVFGSAKTPAGTPYAGFWSGKRATAPQSSSATALGSSSVTWSWGDTLAEEGFTILDANGLPVGLTVMNVTSWTETGLSPDTRYTRSISAFNSYNSSAAPVVGFTDPVPPVCAASTFSAVHLDGFTAAWGSNGNSSGSSYVLEVSADASFVPLAGSATSTALSASVSGLSSNTTYYARVKVNGRNGMSTDYTDLGSTRTMVGEAATAVPGTETLLTYSNTLSTTTVRLPAGAFPSAVSVSVEQPASFPLGLTPTMNTLVPLNVGAEIRVAGGLQPTKEVTVSIKYHGALTAGRDPYQFVIARYDGGSGAWVPLRSYPDPASNTVTAKTSHFSLFQVMQGAPASDLNLVRAYPNPFRPTSQHTKMWFAPLPAGTKVRIYTFVGSLVRELEADSQGNAEWDGRNGAGRSAASGVYIAVLEKDGAKRRLKVAVER